MKQNEPVMKNLIKIEILLLISYLCFSVTQQAWAGSADPVRHLKGNSGNRGNTLGKEELALKTIALNSINVTRKYSPGEEDILQFIWKKGKERMHGKLELLDMYTPYPLVNFVSLAKIPLIMKCRYNVLKTAPVKTANNINPRIPLFEIYNYKTNNHAAGVTDFSIDFSKAGMTTSVSTEISLAKTAENKFEKGISAIIRPTQFCLKKNGRWLRNGRNTSWVRLKAPLFFSRSQVTKNLLFTIADLSKYELDLEKFESDWKPAGGVRVKFTVKDASGKVFPVVNVRVVASDGKWTTPLETEFDSCRMPTGFLRCALPTGYVPEKLGVYAKIPALISSNPMSVKEHEIFKFFKKGDGLVGGKVLNPFRKQVDLPRNKNGTVLETRALYVNCMTLCSREKIDDLIRRVDKAKLNMIIPCVYHLDRIFVKSAVYPHFYRNIEKGLDPLAYLIDKAHAKGIEVHPWFCVNTGNKNLRDWFMKNYQTDISVVSIDRKQKSRIISKYAIDLQNKKYRDYIVQLMLETLKKYHPDGLHLDYIRAKANSNSEANQKEFRKRFGRSMHDATTQDWVEWWKEPVAEIVRKADSGIKKLDNKAVLSASVASVSYTQEGRIQGQNPDLWAQETGLVICPMDYTSQTVLFLMNERGFLKSLEPNRDCLIAGIGMYDHLQIHYPEKDLIAGRKNRDLELIKQQITVARNLGIHGYNLFSDQMLTGKAAEFLGTQVNKEKAIPYFRKND